MTSKSVFRNILLGCGLGLAIICIFGLGYHFGNVEGYANGLGEASKLPRTFIVEALTDMPESQAVAPYLLRQDEKVQFKVEEAKTETWAVAVNYRSNSYFEIDGEPAQPMEHGYILTKTFDHAKPEMLNTVTKAEGPISFFYTSGGGEQVRLWIYINPLEK